MVYTYRPIGRQGQAEAKRERMYARLDEYYKDKQFDLVRRVELPEGQVFRTKMGNRCRCGYVIRDRATGEEQGVGEMMLRIIHERYGNVPLPERFYRRDRRRSRSTA